MCEHMSEKPIGGKDMSKRNIPLPIIFWGLCFLFLLGGCIGKGKPGGDGQVEMTDAIPKEEMDQAGMDGEDANNANNGKGDSSKRELYTDGGRKIVRIAVSNDESWEPWYAGELEYRARKYSQSCDTAVYEVERFDGPLENYLGRGERPDIIVLKDQCAIAHLVELNALADFYPLYEKREKDSPDDIRFDE